MIDLINMVLGVFGYKAIKIEDAVEIERDQQQEQEAKIGRAKTAAETKAERAKEAVSRAVAELRDRGEKINIANVSRVAGVARNTAKKYMAEV